MEENILNFLKLNGFWWIIGLVVLFYLKEFISNLAKSHSEMVAKEMNIKIPKIINNSKSFMKKYSFIFFMIAWYVGLQSCLYWQLESYFSLSQLLSLFGVFNVFLLFIVVGFLTLYFSVISDERYNILQIIYSLHKNNLENIVELQKIYKQNISGFSANVEKIEK